MLINYISNLPSGLRSGGFSAMNVAALEAVSKLGEVHYVGPVNPPADLLPKAISKLLRTLGVPADFSFFSAGRLEAIAAAVNAGCTAEADLDFFHGFTPWIATSPPRPYVAWSDCTFADYIDIYHRRASFRPSDLQRIEQAEAAWLGKAERVLFTSEWARARAIAHYGLLEGRTACVGIFGECRQPDADAYAGAASFVFISTDFEAKGGPVVLAAFRRVVERRPDARLVVVGDRPARAPSDPSVEFVGYLRKESAEERADFDRIFGQARALVHPTRSDIAPLVLIEAAYFGCPVVATRAFAIPELVDEGRTGLLLDDPGDAAELASAMLRLLDDEGDYRSFRRAAWARARELYSRTRFEQRLAACVLPRHAPSAVPAA